MILIMTLTVTQLMQKSAKILIGKEADRQNYREDQMDPAAQIGIPL